MQEKRDRETGSGKFPNENPSTKFTAKITLAPWVEPLMRSLGELLSDSVSKGMPKDDAVGAAVAFTQAAISRRAFSVAFATPAPEHVTETVSKPVP